MEKYIVTEVEVQLERFNQGKAFGLLLSDQLENCGFGGDKHTEKFDTVNRLGCDKEGNYLVNFIGPEINFTQFESAVKSFLDQFLVDLKNEDQIDEFMCVLDENDEEMPDVKRFKLLVTRPYNY